MRVLLATDGSEDARTACAWLAQFPLPADSRLRVVTAVSISPELDPRGEPREALAGLSKM